MDGFDPRYLVVLDELYHCRWAATKKRRMDRFRRSFDSLWPEGHRSRLIHVTGTNGKGSVSHYLSQGFAHCGERTGSWTGPHVFDYAERIHLGSAPAPHEAITEAYQQVVEPHQRRLVNSETAEPLGFPELGILLSLQLFAQREVDWGMMEVGVGGRYTPLRALPQAACVLTNIGDDHPKTLGTEPWQKALEKAGLAQPDRPFFTSAHGPALDYVVATAKSEGAEVHIVDDPARDQVAKLVDLPSYECTNLALAAAVIRHFHPEQRLPTLVTAMTQRLPGRFESPAADLIVDVAHNRNKIAALAERLRSEQAGKQLIFVLGLTRQRDPLQVFSPLLGLASQIFVTSASYAGQDPSAIAARLGEVFLPPVAAIPDPKEALRVARQTCGPEGLVVLTGSAYMIDQALNPNPYVRHLNANLGWRSPESDTP